VLEHASSVVIVPANRVAYTDYSRYRAYICQPNRTFSNDPTRVAFYADQEVKQEVPRIRRTFTDVVFSQDTVATLRASDDVEEAELADIIEQVIANQTGGRRAGMYYDVMLLTAPGDDDTIKLDHPIRHTRRGRGAPPPSSPTSPPPSIRSVTPPKSCAPATSREPPTTPTTTATG
jgi:hypothetical protein